MSEKVDYHQVQIQQYHNTLEKERTEHILEEKKNNTIIIILIMIIFVILVLGTKH
jgi:hypothetical protein